MVFLEPMIRLWRDRRGNFATMMAIAALPVFGAVGLAVEGVDPKKVSNDVKKVMILMTDGENTVSNDLPHASTHNGDDKNLTDNQTDKACRETEDAGVLIYTITFGKEVPAHAKKLMEKRAGSPDRYFDALNSAKLDEAFSTIAGMLMRVRLTH